MTCTGRMQTSHCSVRGVDTDTNSDIRETTRTLNLGGLVFIT
jgi:hypothetical protein